MKRTNFEPIVMFGRDYFIKVAQELDFPLCYDKFIGAKLVLVPPIGEIYETH